MSKTDNQVPAVADSGADLDAGELLKDSAWAAVVRAGTAAEKYEAGRFALETVGESKFGLPIPRLAYDLPWSQGNQETVDAILVNLIAADDIEQATGERELRKAEEICGQPVEIFDMRAHGSDVEPDGDPSEAGGWGFYVSLDVSVDGNGREVVNLGAKQAIVTLWRCWCEGRFPVSGTFRQLGRARKGRSQPVGFDVESKLG